jgi:hypothetical protein
MIPFHIKKMYLKILNKNFKYKIFSAKNNIYLVSIIDTPKEVFIIKDATILSPHKNNRL